MLYSDLQPEVFYLVKSDNEELIELVSVLMQTSTSVLLRSYLPEPEDFFVLKTDSIQIIEELNETFEDEFFAIYDDEEDEEVFEEEDVPSEKE